MITEDYISFEIAKLLKEKGFNKDTYTMSMYDENGEAKDVLLLKVGEEPVLRPTLQMAMKWLREVYKLSIEPYYDVVLTWVVDIKHIGKHTDTREFETVRENCYKTYEEACEAAIKYCLEKII